MVENKLILEDSGW